MYLGYQLIMLLSKPVKHGLFNQTWKIFIICVLCFAHVRGREIERRELQKRLELGDYCPDEGREVKKDYSHDV